MLRNTNSHWGWLHILFHWLTALTVIGLFVLGLWMVDLTYYSPWYNRAPDVHKSVGILLFVLVAVRLAWRLVNPVPADEPGPRWEHRLAHAAHWLIYLLLFAIISTGYLIPTAAGDGISVFGWFTVPAFVTGVENQEVIAGKLHLWLAWTLIALVALHVGGALKQHFINRNRTLKRMLGIRS
ncbi:MAG TPA: cytochrome b [Gammaproteobacteria bacterium]